MKYFLPLILLSLVHAQDGLLDVLEDDPEPPFPVMAAFKGTRVVNAQSLEIPRPSILQFMIQHRFGSIENGFYDLFGMDEASIRFDLQYGFTERLALGVGRSTLNKTYDLLLKTKLLRQMSGSKGFPVSVLWFSNIGVNTERRSETDPAVKDLFANRISYAHQLIIGRKFNNSLSLEILPTIIHRNLVPTKDHEHDLYSIGVAGRWKLSNRFSLNFDHFSPIGDRNTSFQSGWGLGVDIETGGHVFQIMLTNARGSYEGAYIEEATGKLSEGTLYLGFNISRVFSFKNPDPSRW